MPNRDDQPVQRESVLSIIVPALLGSTVLVLMLAYGSTYQVSEGHSAVVTRFGEPVRVVTEPGLCWKWPWPIEAYHTIDMRKRFFDTPYTATFTRDRRNIVLLSYVVWSVEDPLLFYQSLGTLESAEQKLDGMVTAGKNFYFGRYDLTAIVSTNEQEIQLPTIEQAILNEVRKPALEKFGVRVEQVGVKRIAYPEENVSAVLAQMRSERNAEARELRARGTKEAQRIRDEAMVKADEILAAGKKSSGDIIGAAEKESAAIYAQAHRLDPEFYRYWRSMQVVKKTLGAQATVVLRNDQQPFNELFHASGLASPAAVTTSDVARHEPPDSDSNR
jgi:membrane protease subunit HflC